MIVDSSALPEQVVLDAVAIGFNSAGQRCSALRVLCVQDDIADECQRLLAGYMDELVIGDPLHARDRRRPGDRRAARDMLDGHAAEIIQHARWHHRLRAADRSTSAGRSSRRSR